ncbi:MAG TPA: nicotinamide-nucleotide amidohydrolase family protein [Chloroflexia bacterium]|nr:nicotinamide-nucleotide amidohydrolase family protein [Chloroflexia bacterium]
MKDSANSIDVIDSLASGAASLLFDAGLTVAAAESCTGGLLSGALTAIPGSSAYFLGGIISYDNKVKSGILRVPAELIEANGAVSAQVALSMAHRVRDLLGSDIGMSVTGIAGPGGATPGKPVGTTYIALVSGGFEDVRHFCFEGDRAGNRASSVREALTMLLSYLEARVAAGGAVTAREAIAL